MELGIAGRRAAVAGASGGLGFATAAALAAEGVDVVICSRDHDRIHAAADRIAATTPNDGAGGRVVPLVADVSTGEGGRAFAEAAIDSLGGIDILVTNAGGPPSGTFASTPYDAYPDALELNLLSVVGMCQTAVPPMQERGWGRVVAITSLSVRQPIGTIILSNTARAGVTGFLKTLALEVARDGVTVNSVQPGFHDTDRLQSLHGGDTSGVARQVPSGTVGRPEDFGAVVAFLCSDHARYITGAAVPVDGGAYRALL